MTVFTESLHTGDFIVSESNKTRSRDQVTIAESAALSAGAVLGKITTGAATSAAKSGGNTGTGTFVLDGTAPVESNAKVGVYQLRVVATGRAQLKDPYGVDLGEFDFSAGAGVTVDNEIKGVLTDNNATHFAAGDGFDITVAAGSEKYAQFDPAAVNGAQNAVAVLYADADASSGDVAATIVARDAEVKTAELIWKSGVTDDQKTAALAQLAHLGIIGR